MTIYHILRMKSNLYKAQCLLLKWMSLRGQVSYEVIKNYCTYLNTQYELEADEHPAWQIFQPLFKQGNVDSVGEGKFRVTEPTLIKCKQNYLFTNLFDVEKKYATDFAFIYCSKNRPTQKFTTEYTFHATEILMSVPTIDKIVESFENLSVNDFANLEFDNKKKKLGVAKRTDSETGYYFVYPNRKIVSVPNWESAPEAINIAYCYSRVVCEENNGYYDPLHHILKIKRFHLPMILYRVLLLDSLLNAGKPKSDYEYYIFDHISKNVFDELNRILCKSIYYE